MRDGKVLITGGLGFIGLHVAELLIEHGWRVLLFDNLSPQVHGEVPQIPAESLLSHSHVEVFRGDVRRPDDWRKVLPQVQYVIHLAAETGTAQSMYEITRYTEMSATSVESSIRLSARVRCSVPVSGSHFVRCAAERLPRQPRRRMQLSPRRRSMPPPNWRRKNCFVSRPRPSEYRL